MTGIAFVVVRGPALAGKTTVARALAERLPGKVAVVPVDDLWQRWIAGHDTDLALETELVYRQLKLLSATYIRSGYHVVVDGAFAAYHNGVAVMHDSDLRDLLGLVSTIHHVRPLLVNVTAPLDVLLSRANESDAWDTAAVEAMHQAFASTLPAPVVLDTSVVTASEAAERVLEHLR